MNCLENVNRCQSNPNHMMVQSKYSLIITIIDSLSTIVSSLFPLYQLYDYPNSIDIDSSFY